MAAAFRISVCNLDECKGQECWLCYRIRECPTCYTASCWICRRARVDPVVPPLLFRHRDLTSLSVMQLLMILTTAPTYQELAVMPDVIPRREIDRVEARISAIQRELVSRGNLTEEFVYTNEFSQSRTQFSMQNHELQRLSLIDNTENSRLIYWQTILFYYWNMERIPILPNQTLQPVPLATLNIPQTEDWENSDG